jgi:phage replication O-like protein O
VKVVHMTDQPGYTRIPNDLLDAMDRLGNAELRVALAIARKTYGWQKECDRISVSQIVDMTGLTSRNTQKAITSLLKKDLIERTPAGKQAYCYSLKTISLGDTDQNHIPSDPISLGDTEPYPVGTRLEAKPYPLGTTQKKDLKERERKSVSAPKRTPHTRQTNLDSLSESVSIYKQLTNKSPPPTTTTLIATTVVDMSAWHAAVKGWCDRGFKPGNVEGMIDWYLHPEKQQRNTNGHANGKHLRSGTGQHSERKPQVEADLDKPL